MHRIISARPLPGYRLELRFEDGMEGQVDLSPLVGKGVFAAWKDPAEFQRVFIDPESLYEDIAAVAAPAVARDKPKNRD